MAEATDSEIVREWRRLVADGVPPMQAISRALDAVGIMDTAARGRVLDSHLFVGWPPHPREDEAS